LGAKVQNIFEKQVYLIQNNVIILVFCDIATIWFFLDLATGDKATKSEIKCSNVQMFKMIFQKDDTTRRNNQITI
jgi:hypothetical protein